MEKIKIEIAGKEYNVRLAETDDQREKGLQGVTVLKEDEGMLFVFDENEEISF